MNIYPSAAFLPLSSALILAVLLTACSGAPSPETPANPEAQSEPARATGSAGTSVARALDAALERKAWDDLRIESECQDDQARLISARLLGSGVGIWNQERQFTVPRERLLDVLEMLRSAGFPAMRDTHGGKDDPAPGAPAAWGLEMICRVRLRLDGAEKHSYQLSEGRQDAALRDLAEKILAVAEELGPAGATAASLEEGLDKIARGELAPETLTLQLQHQNEDPRKPEEGWILRIEEGRAQLATYDPEDGWTEPRRLPLTRDALAGLARDLAAADLDEMPGNLYSSAYHDLEIRVLNRRKSFQARRFASLTPETHGDRQKRFDQLLETLQGLAL